MNKRMKTALAAVLVMIAPIVWALSQSPEISLGYFSGGRFEVDVMQSTNATVDVYCDGDLVFSCDSGGITYLTPGAYHMYWLPYYDLDYMPAGEYTAIMSGPNGGSFSYGSDWIHGVWSSGYAYVMFIF